MKIKATTTAVQSRAQVFLPIPFKRKSIPESMTFENKWATVNVSGALLSQVHRSILDIIFENYKAVDVSSDGSETYLFSLYDLQKRLGRKSTHNNVWIYEKLLDMQKVCFQIKTKRTASGDMRYETDPTFSIFNSLGKVYDLEKYENMTSWDGKKSAPVLFQVVFNAEYLNFLETDTYISYPLLIPKILSIKCDEAQALARLCLSHKKINHQNLATLMSDSGINEKMMSKSAISRSKGKIIAVKDELEEKLGIKIIVGEKKTDPVRVLYTRDKTLVKFHNDDPEGRRRVKKYNEAVNRRIATQGDDLFENGELL
jgi:hypothetical protein